ncbi:CHASE2 domain-containing protein [[Phormidium] sp. ETS-05]|uniref:CHASE2 domain-containing protein n=1 Tax=[Phormidium] sp. ETS-05 TaxID=222819 RepID=UPI001E45DD1C|nr:CHASE2 domain-containing protein [[Phormidium] sp. ETS-05]
MLKNSIKWLPLLVTAPSVAGAIIALRLMGVFQIFEWAALDQFFRRRPPEPTEHRITVVALDEATIRSVGQWPLPDATLAEVIEKIRASKPRAIGIDLYRDLPVQPGHEELIKVMQSTPNLIGVQKVVKDSLGDKVNAPPVLQKLGQVAAADLVLDGDGKVRRGLLSLETESGAEMVGLGTQMAMMYLAAEGIELEEVAGKERHYRLGQATFIPFAENDGGYVDADDKGYQILLNFIGQEDSFQVVSMSEVLTGNLPEDWVKDNLVFIGATAASLNDSFFTPYSSSLSAFPKRLPGVLIHANITSQILSAALEGHPMMRVWEEPLEWIWIFAWSSLGSILGLSVRLRFILPPFLQKSVFSSEGLILFCFLLVGSGLILVSYSAFVVGWWIPLVPSLSALFLSAITMMGYAAILERQDNARLAHFNQKIQEENQLLETENIRMSAELDLTRRIQEMLLPNEWELEQFLELDIAAFMEPADEVGGDYYDVFKAGNNIIAAIGDVTGHGLESGVVMIMIQTIVRTLVALKCTEVRIFLEVLNSVIYDNLNRMNCDKNATFLIFQYANHNQITIAGQHEEVIIVRNNGVVEQIDPMDLGFPLALVDSIIEFVGETQLQLSPGDVVVLYTDGVTEAWNQQKEPYGLDRMVALIKKNYEKTAKEIKDAVITDLRNYIGHRKIDDDITLVVIKQK